MAKLSLELVASGLEQPLYLTRPNGDSDRLFIVERGGAIKILRLSDASLPPVSFLRITDLNTHSQEQGLLGNSPVTHGESQSPPLAPKRL